MNARGRVVNTNTGMVHKLGCTFARKSPWVEPLSVVPPNKRNKLSKCMHCKP